MPNKRFKIYHTNTLIFTSLILISSILVSVFIGYDYTKGIQQSVLLFSCLFGYIQIISYNDYDVKGLFRKYIRVVYFVSIIGLLQELFYVLTEIDLINEFYNFIGLKTGHITQSNGVGGLMRINSITNEGGTFGICLIPSMIYLHYYNDKYRILGKGKKWLITLTGILTLSPFFYLSIVIILFFKITRKSKMLRAFSTLLAITMVPGIIGLQETAEVNDSTTGIKAVQMKIGDTYRAIADIGNINNIGYYNTSTSVILANTYVALKAPSRIIGTGIGTNAESYENLIGNYYFTAMTAFEGLNADDSYSLLLRITSEFGFVGIILFLISLYKFYNKGNDINVSMSGLVLCLLFRGGGYIDYGIIMAILMMFLTSKTKKSKSWQR